MEQILEHAIKCAGNKSALAKQVGVGQTTVISWCKRGLPERRAQQLVKMYGKKKPKKSAREWVMP